MFYSVNIEWWLREIVSEEEKSEALCKHNQCVMLTTDGFSGTKECLLYSCFLATNMKWVNKKVTILNFSSFCWRYFWIFSAEVSNNQKLRSLGGRDNPLGETTLRIRKSRTFDNARTCIFHVSSRLGLSGSY